ncbi:trypsin-like serine peptidase [Sphaerimonospora mesophila]|uniref:trypsin-like serine peptidase n=1 Tax=Sphaerimonospora mesophila TaxID=37483 RepID=UPI0007C7D2A0
MKHTLTLGSIAATGLLASAVVTATPANAGGDVSKDTLVGSNFAAQQVAAFWFGQNKANLRNAKPYNVETTVPARHISKGGPAPDSKPGIVPSSADKKTSGSRSKNVNLPRTTGKVFFIGADKKPHWCTATSVQSHYRNLVATAGHCVYDTKSNKATMDKWVFVPGYYQGKTPWGIYVGKQAFTHYDFDVYEDGDRDYAFVTVYNGVLPTSTGGSKRYQSKNYETHWQATRALRKLRADKSTGYSHLRIRSVIDTRHVVKEGTRESKKVYVKRADWKKLNPEGTPANGPFKQGTGVTTKKSDTKPAGWNQGHESADGKTFYWKKEGDKYVTRTYWINYDLDYKITGRVLKIGLKDVGRLGDNVGGQGLAYNQKIGKKVFVFGYPSGSHPDGNHAYSGKTLKWSYGKTFAAQAPAIKAQELQGVKSSFTGEGSLGSAWLLNYKNSRRLGYLNGVTIAVADRDGNKRIDTSLSPYFDGETYGVYKAAAKMWSGKIA